MNHSLTARHMTRRRRTLRRDLQSVWAGVVRFAESGWLSVMLLALSIVLVILGIEWIERQTAEALALVNRCVGR